MGLPITKFSHQPAHFGLVDGVVDVVNQPSQRQNLPLADQLLFEVGTRKVDLLGHRARQLGFLHTLVEFQLLLAETQHLPVIERNRHDADQQQGSEHHPKNTRTVQMKRFEDA